MTKIRKGDIVQIISARSRSAAATAASRVA